jgi:hypothetical protein
LAGLCLHTGAHLVLNKERRSVKCAGGGFDSLSGRSDSLIGSVSFLGVVLKAIVDGDPICMSTLSHAVIL